MEIGGLDLGAGESGLDQIVLGQQVGVLQAQALFQPAAVGVGLDPDRGYADLAEHVPQRQAVGEREVQLPALLANIGDAEALHRHAAQGEVAAGREGEILGIEACRIVGQFLQALARVRSPDADAAEVIGPVFDEDRPFLVLGHAPQIGHVAMAGVRAVDDAKAVLGQAQDGEVREHATGVVEEVGVDALADGCVAGDLRGGNVLHQPFRVAARYVVDREVGRG